MLADDLQDPRNQVTRDFSDGELRPLIAKSHRFVLDEESTRLIVNISTQRPGEIAKLVELARLPYERIWVELPRGIKMDQQWKNGTMPEPDPCDPKAMIGYYLERTSETGWRVSISEHDARGVPKYMGWPLGYHFDSEKFVTKNAHYDPAMELDSTALIWGYAGNQPGLDLLMNTAGITMHPSVIDAWMQEKGSYPEDKVYPAGSDLNEILDHIKGKPSREAAFDQLVMPMARELAGTVRFLVALLSTITCVPVEYVDVKPRGMRLINRKPKSYFGYREARLVLPRRRPKNPVQWANGFFRKEIARKRRHKVMGHWRNYRDGSRSWVHEHYRGDPALGYVESKTLITSRKHIDVAEGNK